MAYVGPGASASASSCHISGPAGLLGARFKPIGALALLGGYVGAKFCVAEGLGRAVCISCPAPASTVRLAIAGHILLAPSTGTITPTSQESNSIP